MTKTKAESWKMPKWMEPYRQSIVNTGGNSVEEMVNDRSVVQVNAPRAMLAACVTSQVALLISLQRQGYLTAVGATPTPEGRHKAQRSDA